MSANSSSSSERCRPAHVRIPVQRDHHRIGRHRHLRLSVQHPRGRRPEDPAVAGRVHRWVADRRSNWRGARPGGNEHTAAGAVLRGRDGDGSGGSCGREWADHGVWSVRWPVVFDAVRSLSVRYEQHHRSTLSSPRASTTCTVRHQIRRYYTHTLLTYFSSAM